MYMEYTLGPSSYHLCNYLCSFLGKSVDKETKALISPAATSDGTAVSRTPRT